MKWLLLILLVLTLIGCSSQSEDNNNLSQDNLKPTLWNISKDTLKISSWNLQVFGRAKMQNLTLMQKYVDVMDDYDVIFVQEIRDESGEAFKKLCSMLPDYKCWVSSRAGTTKSREQIGILSHQDIKIDEFIDYNADQEIKPNCNWERPPVRILINGNYIYNMHVKPDKVKEELSCLEEFIKYYETDNKGEAWIELRRDDIVSGDLNSACQYYPIRENFLGWEWIIPDNADTTVNPNTHCSYDEFIVDKHIRNRILSYGIDTRITPDMSDHYLVWIEVKR